MIVLLAAFGRPALAISGDQLSYLSPFPRRTNIANLKSVGVVPGRRVVVLETTAKPIYISTVMLSPSANPEKVADAMREALQLPAA
jgi:hypothetical protein